MSFVFWRRLLLNIALSGGALAALSPGVRAVVSYTLTDLGSLDNSSNLYSSFATGINASGEVSGYSYTSVSAGSHAFLYSGGVMSDIGGGNSVANGINDSGQVVGYITGIDGFHHAFLYSAGNLTDLSPQVGVDTIAYAINNSGQVVGKGPTFSNSFFYSGGVGTLFNTLGAARALNDSGNFAGGGANFAYVVNSGIMTNFGTLAGGGPAHGYGMNNQGDVVGAADFSFPSAYDLIVYHNGTLLDLGRAAPTADTYGYDINATGQIVGEYRYTSMSGLVDQGFLYENGSFTDMDSLPIINLGTWHDIFATAINDNGQIAGWGTDGTGRTHALLISPVPEPAAFAFGVTLTAGLVALSRRYYSRAVTRRTSR